MVKNEEIDTLPVLQLKSIHVTDFNTAWDEKIQITRTKINRIHDIALPLKVPGIY